MAALAAALLVAQILSVAVSESNDVVSMLQHGAKASQPVYELGMRNWISDFYRFLQNKKDPLMEACCNMVKETHISPMFDWGQATHEQQLWWTETGCDSVVTDVTMGRTAHGAPNCQNVQMLQQLVPRQKIKDPIELYSEDSACSEVDRAQINATYYGEAEPVILPFSCNSMNIAENGRVKWDEFRTCVQRILDVSVDCAGCYADFLKALGDSNSNNHGCMDLCHVLEACPYLEVCKIGAKQCLGCMQPALNDYYKCMGGPVENQLNVEDIMRKIVHVWGSISN